MPVPQKSDLSGPHYPSRAAIDGYGDGWFRFAGVQHKGSLLILPSGMRGWRPESLNDVHATDLHPILAERSEIALLLFGAGATMALLPGSLRESDHRGEHRLRNDGHWRCRANLQHPDGGEAGGGRRAACGALTGGADCGRRVLPRTPAPARSRPLSGQPVRSRCGPPAALGPLCVQLRDRPHSAMRCVIRRQAR